MKASKSGGRVLEEAKKSLPWIEKYRPKTLDDIAHQEHVVKALRQTLETGNLPHLLFYGPPGTGKTSTILAVARQLYGPNLLRKRVLELNASSDRGIKAIREKVKTFAKVAVGNQVEKGYPCPPFKIIILDEADSMTKDAQTALRRTMEAHSTVTRFCIICNYVTRIIEPISSRCAKFRFASLSAESMTNKLHTITKSENVNCDEKTLEYLINVSGGDMRRSITTLQTAQNIVGIGESLTTEDISEISGVIPKKISEDLVEACKAKMFTSFEKRAREVISQGYPVLNLLPQLLDVIVSDKEFDDIAKSKISIAIADAERKLIDGADEWLQLLQVLSVATKAAPQK
mmetsp:Transcript_9043/g.13543  ORF Transcript_9043/g.13543 Transcript_9043/m.13543 type:complete len:345 (-) Transcript_9043:104-1138(-)